MAIYVRKIRDKVRINILLIWNTRGKITTSGKKSYCTCKILLRELFFSTFAYILYAICNLVKMVAS